MKLRIKGGFVRAIHSDRLSLASLGQVKISRASHVEPNEKGRWFADMAPVGGPRLDNNGKGYGTRSAALRAEVEWLNKHPESWGKIERATHNG
jgi:hypothetical protein